MHASTLGNEDAFASIARYGTITKGMEMMRRLVKVLPTKADWNITDDGVLVVLWNNDTAEKEYHTCATPPVFPHNIERDSRSIDVESGQMLVNFRG